MKTLELWQKFESPPESALKRILGGKLKGKYDINPQWRYKALTEVFGPCGLGWKYEVTKRWTEPGPEGQVIAFVDINFFYMVKDEDPPAAKTKAEKPKWSAPVPGTGGAMLIAEEKGRLVANDEAYKMATTDALSVATKMLGIAANVYLGRYDGKYADDGPAETGKDEAPEFRPLDTQGITIDAPPTGSAREPALTDEEVKKIQSILARYYIAPEAALAYLKSIGGLIPHHGGLGLAQIKHKYAQRIINTPEKFVMAYKDYIIKKAEEANE